MNPDEANPEFEEAIGQHLADQLNAGGRIIVQSTGPCAIGEQVSITGLMCGASEYNWPQPFAVIRESTRAEYEAEMGTQVPDFAEARYYEVMAD